MKVTRNSNIRASGDQQTHVSTRPMNLSEQISPEEALAEFDVKWVGKLAYFDSGEHRGYSMFSTSADVQRTSEGVPMCTLLAMGDGGFLNVVTELGPHLKQLDSLRAKLVAQGVVAAEDEIVLSNLSLKVNRASLWLGDRSGAANELAYSQSSGTPPFAALFAQQLTRDELPLVNAALNGEAGLLVAEYDFSVSLPVSAAARLDVDVLQLVNHFRERGIWGELWDREFATPAIDDLLQSNVIVITYQGALNHELRQQLHAQLILELIEWLEANSTTDQLASENELCFERALKISQSVTMKIRSDAADWGATGLELN